MAVRQILGKFGENWILACEILDNRDCDLLWVLSLVPNTKSGTLKFRMAKDPCLSRKSLISENHSTSGESAQLVTLLQVLNPFYEVDTWRQKRVCRLYSSPSRAYNIKVNLVISICWWFFHFFICFLVKGMCDMQRINFLVKKAL